VLITTETPGADAAHYDSAGLSGQHFRWLRRRPGRGSRTTHGVLVCQADIPDEFREFPLTSNDRCLTRERICQYRLKIPHSANRKIHHPAEIVVYKFSRSVENETGW
jgi:hypothetical protein